MAGKYFFKNASFLFFPHRAFNNLKLTSGIKPLIAFQKNISKIASLDTATNRLVIKIKNVAEEFPFVWLRDNCQCSACYDPSSKSRTISFADFQLDSKPKSVVR